MRRRVNAAWRKRGAGDAIVFWGEDKVKRRLSWAQLYTLVARLAEAMRAMGVEAGDRVAGSKRASLSSKSDPGKAASAP